MTSIYLPHENAKLLEEAVKNVSKKHGYTDEAGVYFCTPAAHNTEIKFEDDLSPAYFFYLFNEYAELRLSPRLVTLGELAAKGEIS